MNTMIVNQPNWELLREQKRTLLKITFNEKQYPKLSKDEIEHIDGVIAYIDYIQDVAVDEYGIPSSRVFDRSAMMNNLPACHFCGWDADHRLSNGKLSCIFCYATYSEGQENPDVTIVEDISNGAQS